MDPEVKKILIVDDEDFIVNLIATAVRKEGHLVHTCGDIQSALSLLEKEKIHLVITDLRIPGSETKSLSRHMRESENLRSIPVILITGASPNALVGERHLVQAILPKPFDLKQLSELVKLHLGSGQSTC